MTRGERLDRTIAKLAMRQHSAFNLDQAERAGATRGLVEVRLRGGRWERATRRVFIVAGSAPTWHQALWVAILGSVAPAIASHQSAAALLGLDGLEPGPVEILVPRGRRPRGVDARVHETDDLPRSDITKVDGIPVTRAERTLIDIAASVSKEVLESALDDAIRRGLISVQRLAKRVASRRGQPGMAKLGRLLAARTPGARTYGSALEAKLVRILERAGLPAPIPQYMVTVGRRRMYIDFAYPEERIAIEVEGYRWHSGRLAWERDTVRRTAIGLNGWLPLGLPSGKILHEPAWVVETVREALEARRVSSSS